MANIKAKTINLLLYEGNLSGVISLEDSGWNSGELYSAPRDSVSELFETDACKKYGVYLLLSQDKVYVGQSSDLAKRITQHIVGKDWWESVVILTTKDDNFTRADIDYLESVLIEKAKKINCLDCDNKNKGNGQKVSKYRKIFLDQYLEEALFLMQLIGITVFTGKKEKSFINTVVVKTKLALGKRAKQDAIQYLRDNGVYVGSKVTYAVKGQNRDEYWANPRIDLLLDDWWLILNDNESMELIILNVPAEELRIKQGEDEGLYVRVDKKEQIDLKINRLTLKDQKSNIDFSPYVVKRFKY